MKKYFAWEKFPTNKNRVGWELLYICTLPGKPDAFGSAPNSGYGYDNQQRAVQLTERQANRFLKDKRYLNAQPGSFGVTEIG